MAAPAAHSNSDGHHRRQSLSHEYYDTVPELDVEALREREERARLDSGMLSERVASGELHGIYYAKESDILPAAVVVNNTAANPSSSGELATLDIEQAADAAQPSDNHVLELLQPISEASGQKPLTLSFKGLSVWAPINPKKPNLLQQAWQQCISRGKAVTNPKRQILYSISGQIRPNEVLALMGPSGSGKTSLLTVLGGRSAMKFKGRVFVNEQPYTKATRRRIGFVLQDDVLYESLTVKETLTYAALLRLPKEMSSASKLERVEQVIDALGLRKSKDTIIGGFFRRGISGGERKRVSIGHELLINPAILMLDEPTSGLDSTTAMHLLTLLQDLAAGGRAIATTIHQPSSRLYQKLDWLMLLAEGHVIYYNKADQVLDYFAQFGYKMPFGVSIADYILDISLGEAGCSSSGKTGNAAVQELWTVYESSDGSPGAAAAAAKQLEAVQAADLKHTPHSSSAALQEKILIMDYAGSSSSTPRTPASSHLVPGSNPDSASTSMKGKHEKHQGAAYWQQLQVLFQRSGRVRRFEQMTGQHFFQLFAVAFITGLVWWQRGQDYYGGVQAANDVMGLLFFMLLFPSMRSLFRALFTFPNEYRMLMKERPSGMYNLSAYYLARTAADFPAELLNVVLFAVISYWFGGLRHTAGAFFGLLFSLVLVTFTAESWGLLVGGVFMEPKTAQTVTTVVMLAFLLVGGYYVRNIPVWIGWIRYLSFLYWGYNLLIKTQFSDVTYYSCTGAGSCTPVPPSALSLQVHPTDPAYPDVLILIAMLIFLRLCVYFVLRKKTSTVPKKMD